MDRCRSVGELRPKPALLLSPELSVVDAAVKMLGANADSGLVVSAEGALVGILTDKDVTNRVIANRADPTSMLVSEVMTANPMTVKASDNAIDALCLMIERRFRHLPVLDEHGAVVGMLDIAKCLYDAISRLERHLSSASSALSTAVLAALPAGAGAGSAQGLVDDMVQRLFAPSLAVLLQSAERARAATAGGAAPPALTLAPHETAERAAKLMAARGGAVLVGTAEAPCAGIVTFKDLLFKLVAKGRSAADVTVETLMTRAPDTMPATASVLQALHQLQYGGYRNIPVLGADGAPLGVLDVLVLMEGALVGSGGQAEKIPGAASATASRWSSLLKSSESLVGVSAGVALGADGSRPPSRPVSRPTSYVDLANSENLLPTIPPPAPVAAAPADFSLPPSVAASWEPSQENASEGANANAGTLGAAPAGVDGGPSTFLFKVTEPRTQHMHRLHAPSNDLRALEKAVASKLGQTAEEGKRLLLRYDDDEGDRVLITSDAELSEACEIAGALGKKALVLHASYERVAHTPLGERNGTESAAGAKAGAKGASAGASAGRMLGSAIGGMNEQERIMGAGALLAGLMVGISVLAGRR